MKTLSEYLNSKGKVETGTVDIHGDRTDPMTPPNKPPKEHGDKPYANSDGKNTKKSDKGLGDQGDSALKYEPDTSDDTKKAASIPTAENFAQYELIPLVCETLERNSEMAEHIVRGLKRKGLLGPLVGELMEHRETYQHIQQLVSHENGQHILKKLQRAMEEEVSPSYSSKAEEDDLEKTSLEDVEIDDDTMDMDVESDDFVEGEDFEFDDTEELGDMNGMGGGEEDPDLQKPLPSFKQAMMSRM